MEIITKKGTKIEVIKVTKDTAQGEGQRLGVAYRLKKMGPWCMSRIKKIPPLTTPVNKFAWPAVTDSIRDQ